MMKFKLFQIASLMVILAGVVVAAFDMITDSFDGIMTISGFVVAFIGVILLISGFVWATAAEAKEVQIISYVLIAGSIAVMAGVIVPVVAIGGAVIILIGFLMWPCICCQSEQKSRSKVIGIARSHDKITITEMSQITGMSSDTVRTIIYDAIGKRELIGKMEGETFMRSAPGASGFTTPSTTHRETVKVLVICPYCGAKTEQGLTKCQNCQADL